MKVPLLTAAALISLFGLIACTGPTQSDSSASANPPGTPPSALPSETPETPSADSAATQSPSGNSVEPTAQAATPLPGSAGSTPDKSHFAGDYTQTTATNSPEHLNLVELAKQWHSADKEALFHEKMDASGLSSSVPVDQAETFYGQAAAACQRRFDGYAPPLEGVWLEIENLALSVYCPELS